MDQAFVFWVGWKGQALPSQRESEIIAHKHWLWKGPPLANSLSALD